MYIGKGQRLIVSNARYASFSQFMNHIGIGICGRGDGGTFVLTKIMSFSPLCHVSVGEVLGLFNAIQWLSDM